MKKKIIITILVALVAVSVIKDKLIEVSVEKIAELVLGTKLDIRSMRVGVLTSSVKIKDMQLYNPEGYPGKLMADVPEIYVDFSPMALLKGTIYLNEIRFHLKELNIVKNKDGKVNLNTLKPVSTKTEGKELEKKEKGKTPDIKIKKLHLKGDKVSYSNYSKDPENPTIRNFNVNVDIEYEDINNPYTFVRLIISSVLRDTAISNIVKMPMKEVKEIANKAYKKAAIAAKKVAATATEVAEKGTEVAGRAVKTTTRTAEKLVDTSSATLKDVAKGIKGIIKNPFSKKK